MAEVLFPEGAVLVVGGSGGVGQAVCREFARAGTDVALTYRSKHDVAELVAADVRALGRKVSTHQLTIGDAEQVAAVVDNAALVHGRLHSVVFAAGSIADSVLLGVIEAGMFLELSKRGVFDEHWVQEVQKTLALKRWGKPEEIGFAAVFLASSRAAYITGQRLAVTGGYAI
jgi:NAD(P)-dependent dehydrogenase (short-subunit alcohol dehydrogenase family)